MSLEDHIKNEIKHSGPMDIAQFMGAVISHYYNSRDPFGEAGDFITAPEISQMFGEMLGAWAADIWIQLGKPESFAMVECGPGRGTLMSDMLRICSSVEGFHAAAKIHLVEQSDKLKNMQKETLSAFDVSWHDDLSSLPDDVPIILFANEFLDALPVHQLQYNNGAWQERVIGLDNEGGLQFGLKATNLRMPHPALPRDGDICEVSPVQNSVIESVSQRLDAQGGAALFVDYGYTSGYGDSLQALKAHKSVDILQDIGESDLTAHVDFAALKKAALHCDVFGPAEQGGFLKALGIDLRAQFLRQNANDRQAKDIDEALHRLTHEDQMGSLFKVIALASKGIRPAGL